MNEGLTRGDDFLEDSGLWRTKAFNDDSFRHLAFPQAAAAAFCSLVSV
jgi:hypothetical protein